MARREPFVAEVAVDLVHTLETADHQPFQVELRCDAQVHVDAERVVVRDERPGYCTARDRLHHRRLDLEEAPCIEHVAQETHEARALLEHRAAVLVHDQVDIALTIARLGIRKAVPFVGQGLQGLHQQTQPLHAHRQLAGLGAEQHALRAEDVTDIPAFEIVVRLLAERLALHEYLDLPGGVLELDEARLAHDASQHHPAGDLHPYRRRLERLIGQTAVAEQQLAGERIPTEIIGERRAACRTQRCELGTPFGDQLVLVFGHRPALSEASRKGSRSPSSTAVVLPTSISVRRSLMRDWSST